MNSFNEGSNTMKLTKRHTMTRFNILAVMCIYVGTLTAGAHHPELRHPSQPSDHVISDPASASENVDTRWHTSSSDEDEDQQDLTQDDIDGIPSFSPAYVDYRIRGRDKL